MAVRQHNDKVTQFLGDLKFHWKFWGDKKIESPKFEYPILFGIEMEYEVGRTPVEIEERLYRGQVSDRLEHTYKHFAFAKHDGSLNNGFEVVSVPMSFDAHTEQWKPFFNEAVKNGLEVSAKCAMHVHVSRDLLTPLQIGKILALIYRKDNEEFLKKLCGRAKMVYLGEHRYREGIGTEKKITDVNRHLERYAAVNITGADTIEFRIFKSTLELNTMLQNLEFCDGLVRFAWPSNVGIRDIQKDGLKHLFKFVLDNRKTYPRLAEFLRKNEYISWEIKKVPKKYTYAATSNYCPVVRPAIRPVVRKKLGAKRLALRRRLR